MNDDEITVVSFFEIRPDPVPSGCVKARVVEMTRLDLVLEREHRARLFRRILAETEILIACDNLRLDYAKIKTDTWRFHRAVNEFFDECDRIDTMLETGVGYTL